MGENDSGLGGRLRAARARLGLSREELAVRSGISWSAIAQAESGRRRNLRPRTLSRLSVALGVSVDYLIDGRSAPTMLSHQALLYDSDDAFAEGTARFLLAGADRSEALLVLTNKRNLKTLRKRLGADADRVKFVDSDGRMSGPDEVLACFREFLNDRLQQGAVWARIVGEPIWAGRSRSEVRLWTKYESLINLLFGSAPISLLCPYDRRALSPAIVRDAHVTHPELIEGETVTTSNQYADPGSYTLER